LLANGKIGRSGDRKIGFKDEKKSTPDLPISPFTCFFTVT